LAELTRRIFLKTGLAGLSSLVLMPRSLWAGNGPDALAVEEYVSTFTGRRVKGVPTVCGLCSAACGLLAFVDEGGLVGVAGNPDHPRNLGALCALGSAALQIQDSPARILKPLRRAGRRGEGVWQEATWEQAFGEAAAVLKKVRSGTAGGPLAASAPGRELTPLLRHFLKAFPGAILNVADGYELGVERELRAQFPSRDRGDPDSAVARLVFNFGANPLGSTSGLIELGRLIAGRDRRDCCWVTFDPRLSETANQSDEWIPVRPGTDRFLALAVANVLLENGWEDRAFLSRATDLEPGRLRDTLREWTPERAAALCQVPASDIRRLAEGFGREKNALAICGSGVTARKDGLDAARSIFLLNILKGNAGGAGGSRARSFENWRLPGSANRVGAPAVAGGALSYDLIRGRRKIGCLLTVSADPVTTDPDGAATEALLKDLDKVPYHVSFASTWNETARLADLVLPAATFLESWGVHVGCVSGEKLWVGLRQPAVRPPADSRSPEDALLGIARMMGGDAGEIGYSKSAEDYCRRLLQETFPEEAGKGLWASLKSKGWSPVNAGSGGGLEQPTGTSVAERKEDPTDEYSRGDKTQGTSENLNAAGRDRLRSGRAGGRLELAACLQEIVLRGGGREGAEGIEKTLILFTSPTRGDGAGLLPWVEEIDHASPVWMNPRAAAELGLKEGDRVSVAGPAGEIRTRVRLTEGIHPEAVAVQFLSAGGNRLVSEEAGRAAGSTGGTKAEGQGSADTSRPWWGKEMYGENARRLVPWPDDPHRQAPGWKDTRVKIRKL